MFADQQWATLSILRALTQQYIPHSVINFHSSDLWTELHSSSFNHPDCIGQNGKDEWRKKICNLILNICKNQMFRVKICRVWVMFSDFQIQKIAFLRIKMCQKDTKLIIGVYRKILLLTRLYIKCFLNCLYNVLTLVLSSTKLPEVFVLLLVNEDDLME